MNTQTLTTAISVSDAPIIFDWEAFGFTIKAVIAITTIVWCLFHLKEVDTIMRNFAQHSIDKCYAICKGFEYYVFGTGYATLLLTLIIALTGHFVFTCVLALLWVWHLAAVAELLGVK